MRTLYDLSNAISSIDNVSGQNICCDTPKALIFFSFQKNRFQIQIRVFLWVFAEREIFVSAENQFSWLNEALSSEIPSLWGMLR